MRPRTTRSFTDSLTCEPTELSLTDEFTRLASTSPTTARGAWRRWNAALLAAVSLAVGMAIGCGPGGLLEASQPAKPRREDAETWVELTTPRLVIKTNLPATRADDVAHQLEETRAAILALAWPHSVGPPGQTEVVVYAHDEQLHAILGPNATGTLMNDPPYANTMVLSFDPRDLSPNTPSHEMAHLLTRWFMPRQPRWLLEGLARFLEDIHLDRKTQTATMGRPPARALPVVQTRSFAPVSLLFRLDARATIPDPPGVDGFYATAWLVVHYLVNRREDAFGRFQRRLGSLEDWRQAWEAEFPDLTPRRLDRELLHYVQAPLFSVITRRVTPPAFSISRRPLTSAEVLGLNARLRWSRTGAVAAAELGAREALRMDPHELEALSVLFNLPTATRKQKAEYAHLAVAAHPNRWLAWVMAAEIEEDAAAWRAALERAFTFGRNEPEVLQRLARDKLLLRDKRAALDLSRLALRIGGDRPGSLLMVIDALLMDGQCEAARGIARAALNDSAEPWHQDLRRDWDSMQWRCGKLDTAISSTAATPAAASATTAGDHGSNGTR